MSTTFIDASDRVSELFSEITSHVNTPDLSAGSVAPVDSIMENLEDGQLDSDTIERLYRLAQNFKAGLSESDAEVWANRVLQIPLQFDEAFAFLENCCNAMPTHGTSGDTVAKIAQWLVDATESEPDLSARPSSDSEDDHPAGEVGQRSTRADLSTHARRGNHARPGILRGRLVMNASINESLIRHD